MTEHTKAQKWREGLNLSRAKLAELTGYSYEAIRFFEMGKTSKDKKIDGYAWQRYKRACQAVQDEIKGNSFNW